MPNSPFIQYTAVYPGTLLACIDRNNNNKKSRILPSSEDQPCWLFCALSVVPVPVSSSGEFLSFLENDDDDATLRRHCWKEVPALSPAAALSLSPRPWRRWRRRSRRELIHENGAQWGTQSGKGALCTGEHKTEAGDGTEKEERRDRHDFFL